MSEKLLCLAPHIVRQVRPEIRIQFLVDHQPINGIQIQPLSGELFHELPRPVVTNHSAHLFGQFVGLLQNARSYGRHQHFVRHRAP